MACKDARRWTALCLLLVPLSLGATCGGNGDGPPNVYFYPCDNSPEWFLEYKTAANSLPQSVTPGCHYIANPIGLHARCSAENPDRSSAWIAITLGSHEC